MRTASIVVTLLLSLTACSGATGGDASSQSETSTAPTASPTSAAADADEGKQADRCEIVPMKFAEAIVAEGAEDGVGRLKALDAAAVRSRDYEKAYMIAVRFKGPGIDSETGVWSSNSLKLGGGLILAVDGLAKEFTVWPDADKTDAGMSIADDGVDEAKDCLS